MLRTELCFQHAHDGVLCILLFLIPVLVSKASAFFFSYMNILLLCLNNCKFFSWVFYLLAVGEHFLYLRA